MARTITYLRRTPSGKRVWVTRTVGQLKRSGQKYAKKATASKRQSSHAKAGLHRTGTNTYVGKGGKVFHRVGKGKNSRCGRTG